MKEKEPMSMEEYADRITDKIKKEYGTIIYVKGECGEALLWNIIFDAIQLFQGLQDEKHRNLKEEYQERKLEKERQEGK